MTIRIVPYDDDWPRLFEEEAARIRAAMGADALRIEHVGSTSVPGLAAKPVIDVQVSVSSLACLDAYLPALERLAYTHVPLGEFDAVYPFFQRPNAWPTTHHLHLCVAGAELERQHLAFRDLLRCDRELCLAYVELKHRLALKNVGDTFESRVEYSLDKSEFVNAALRSRETS